MHFRAASERAIIHLAYIVAKGIPVATAACSLAIGGNVRRLPRSDFVEHVGSTQEVCFSFDEAFKTNYPQVVSAIKHCAKNADCNWSVGGKAASGGNSRSSARGSGDSNRSTGPGSGGSNRSTGPASGGSNKPPKRSKKVTVQATTLESLWQSLLLLRRVRNSKSAPLVWRRDRVGM